MKVKVRTKNKYMKIGYIESRTVEVSDYYAMKEFVENDLRLCRIGDERWEKVEQDFDQNSIYITDGTIIRWYELIN